MLVLLVALLLGLVLVLFLALAFLCYPRPAHVPFKNRHVLITGGSSGIGLELAKQALLEGAHVSILARDLTRLKDAKEAITKATGKDDVRIFSADVKDFESLKKVAGEAGPVDVLVCSHGVSIPRTLEDATLDEINHIIDTNLKGNIHVIKAMLPYMKNRSDPKTPASIAIFSSQAGQVGLYGYTFYSASKFSLRGIAEALQQEVHNYNIRVSLVFPPDTFTPGFDKENETKPEITKLLCSSSSAMNATEVAKKTIDGIKAGSFFVNCNFDGWMLSIATSGMSPQPSCINALAEVFLCGLMRFVALCVTWNWYRTLINWERQQNKVK